ncbi:MAG: DUF2807 domain-containing protein [Dehalococcoidales bacterium]|nr:DUF2807 domain-containing protein [Dehalococcoidales bacterium]
MKIKNLTAFMAIMVLLIVPCISGCLYPVSGSGNLVTEQFNYTDFDCVQVSHVFKVEISQSDTFSISVTADDNIMEYVIINLSGDTLQVRLKQGYNYHSITAVAKISMPDISHLDMSGATGGIIKDFISSNNVSIQVSGASNLTLSDLATGNIKIEISGASNVTGSLAADDARFNISGASNLSLSGSGHGLKTTVSGASKMSLDNFTTDDADVNISGASTAVVNTTGTLDAAVSGASTLYYIGNPVLGDINISGASGIQKK